MDELSGLMPEMPADCVICRNWFELNDMYSCPSYGCYDQVICAACYKIHKSEHEDADL